MVWRESNLSTNLLDASWNWIRLGGEEEPVHEGKRQSWVRSEDEASRRAHVVADNARGGQEERSKANTRDVLDSRAAFLKRQEPAAVQGGCSVGLMDRK